MTQSLQLALGLALGYFAFRPTWQAVVVAFCCALLLGFHLWLERRRIDEADALRAEIKKVADKLETVQLQTLGMR